MCVILKVERRNLNRPWQIIQCVWTLILELGRLKLCRWNGRDVCLRFQFQTPGGGSWEKGAREGTKVKEEKDEKYCLLLFPEWNEAPSSSHNSFRNHYRKLLKTYSISSCENHELSVPLAAERYPSSYVGLKIATRDAQKHVKSSFSGIRGSHADKNNCVHINAYSIQCELCMCVCVWVCFFVQSDAE